MESLDYNEDEITNKKPNALLNTFCILGYIGNGLLFLLFLIMLLAMDIIFENPEVQQALASTPPELDPKSFFRLLIFIVLGFTGLSILGLVFAHLKKTWGFILYAVVNGIWALLLIVSFSQQGNFQNLILALLSITFIVIIGINHKK